MSDPFLAEIRMVGFNFAPRGYATCDGQLLPIAQNQSLFSLLGTLYGGDGRTSFALPDLRGRAGVHEGQGPGLTGYSLGQRGGSETETLSIAQIPAHSHIRGTGNQARSTTPEGNVVASRPRRGARIYTSPPGTVPLAGQGSTGGGQAHDNMQPFTVIQFVIALQGTFPSRN
jgi:microcystin-dependent protein